MSANNDSQDAIERQKAIAQQQATRRTEIEIQQMRLSTRINMEGRGSYDLLDGIWSLEQAELVHIDDIKVFLSKVSVIREKPMLQRYMDDFRGTVQRPKTSLNRNRNVGAISRQAAGKGPGVSF